MLILFAKVVGSIDQMEVDDPASAEKNSAGEAKNASDSDKSKAKRKLYVGSQALGFRRDYMEVCLFFFKYSFFSLIHCL